MGKWKSWELKWVITGALVLVMLIALALALIECLGAPEPDPAPPYTPPPPLAQVATQPGVEISPAEPRTDDNLVIQITTQGTCTQGNILYEYKWSQNGQERIEFFNLLTVSSEFTTEDDVWECSVTPICDQDRGTSVTDQVSISPALTNTVRINFDELTVAEGTSSRFPTIQYKPRGVIIGNRNQQTNVLDGFVVVDHLYPGHGASSEPHSVVFGSSGLSVEVIFVDPITGEPAVTNFVSAQVGDKSSEVDVMWMTAYDINGEVMEAASYTSQPSSQLDPERDFGEVKIEAEGIHYVVFTDESPSGASFDDLVFNSPVVPD